MVMWSHWNYVEKKNLLIHHSDKLKRKNWVFTYLPVGHSYGSHPHHVIRLIFDCKIFRGKKKNVTFSKLGISIISGGFFVLFFCLLVGWLTCAVILIPNIPRPTYMHFPITHGSCSPVWGAGRGSRGSWWSCLARCTSVQQAALSDHPPRCLQQRPHAGRKEWFQQINWQRQAGEWTSQVHK